MTPETITEKPSTDEQPLDREVQKGIARAMQGIGDVAKLYKKHGSPANYHWATTTDEEGHVSERITSSFNHAWKRSIRLSAWCTRPVKRAMRMRCATCGGWFVGPTNVRCQCPVAKPQKRVEEE